MLDLTTLEGADTPGKVRQLAAKAVCPSPTRPEIPDCAAVCVYPSLVGVAREAVAGTGVHVASVATAFPSGRARSTSACRTRARRSPRARTRSTW